MSIVWAITARETMARTKRHLGAPQVAQLPPAGMRAKIKRVKAPIGDLEGFDPQSVQTRPDPRINVSEGSIDEAPIDTFAYDTPQHNFAEELLLSIRLGTITSSRRALLECRCRSGRCVGRAAPVRSLTHLLAHADKMREECWPGRVRPKKEH